MASESENLVLRDPLSLRIVTSTLLIATLVYTLYLYALPKPIPAIPYNVESARRLLGDLPNFIELKKNGRRPVEFWANATRRHRSAIVQYFGLPFNKPLLILSDYQEVHYLLNKRAKYLDKGVLNNGLWTGLIPNHFIALNASDPRYTQSKFLSKDLMSQKFLYNISIPASYSKVVNFIKLWQLKEHVANGRPFEVSSDMNFLASDIIMAAALGIQDEESDIIRQIQYLQGFSHPIHQDTDSDQTYEFDRIEVTGLLKIILDSATTIGAAAIAPSRRLYWWLTNLRPSIRAMKYHKRRILQEHIDRAHRRFGQVKEGDTPFTAAVDYIVSRELSAAAESARPPVLDSELLHDTLFGYCLGGQDTTHSVMLFIVKALATHQDEQRKVRSSLQQAYSAAAEERRDPSMDEILKTQAAYLDAFIEEVLRLNSVAPVVVKETLEDITLLGHRITKGTQIICPLWGPSITESAFKIHEDLRGNPSETGGNKDWSSSGFAPDQFEPRRWLKYEDGKPFFNPKAGPTLSFGTGSRECWGRKLAYLELKLVTTLLLWSFDFLPLPPSLIDDEVVDILNSKPKKCYVRISSKVRL